MDFQLCNNNKKIIKRRNIYTHINQGKTEERKKKKKGKRLMITSTTITDENLKSRRTKVEKNVGR